MSDEIDLNEEEEAALERVWAAREEKKQGEEPLPAQESPPEEPAQ